MTREKAESMAKEFIGYINPELWNGDGEKPASFKEMTYEFPLDDEYNLEIVCNDDGIDGWCHFCDIVNIDSNESMYMLSGYGIDSIFNLADTIMDICDGKFRRRYNGL